jgi:GTPase SAR1 family protein
MRISDVRATLYILLTALENDMRGFIKTLIIPHFNELDFFKSPQTRDKALERIAKDTLRGASKNYSPSDLVDYLDYKEAYEMLLSHHSFLYDDFSSMLKAHAENIDSIVQIRNRVMHSRPLLAGDLHTILSFTHDLVYTSKIKWPALSSTLNQLETDPSFILNISVPIDDDYDRALHNLPLPDFDETGFIGRSKDVSEVRKLLTGHNNVITIVGEGGIGKSALLLKAVYDLLDTGDNCPFQNIIWVSTKTTALTQAGITEIRDAIRDLNGLVAEVAGTFKNKTDDFLENMQEILEIVKAFNTLLVIDNLETIVSPEVRDFIYTLQEHCKIAITSRIGLGELELRRSLGPMGEREAEALLRYQAQVCNTTILLELPTDKINIYLRDLHYNPLAIKWFVQAVSSGRSPQEVLCAKDQLLDYCLSNVYDKLNANETMTLNHLLAARRPSNEAELCYYSDLDPIATRQALNSLVATSFITRSISRQHEQQECMYSVNALSREFLIKNYPPSEGLVSTVSTKKRALTGAYGTNLSITAADPFSVNAIQIRTGSEAVAARSLQAALLDSRKKELGYPLDSPAPYRLCCRL